MEVTISKPILKRDTMEANLIRLTEEMNFRLLCGQEGVSRADLCQDYILWVESITVTAYEEGAIPTLEKKCSFIEKLGYFLNKKLKWLFGKTSKSYL